MATRYLLGNAPTASSWPWLTMYEMTQTFGVNGETGVDLGTPYATAITSLTDGVIAGRGYYGGGGVVSVNTVINGATVCVYYQHLDEIDSGAVVGATVAPGTLLGISGGQLSGGNHPSSRTYSSGAHTEVGFNAPYGGFWNPNGYGPNFDPVPLLRAIASNTPGAPGGVIHATGALVISASTAPGFTPIAQALNDAEQLAPWDALNIPGSLLENAHALAIRGVIVMLGVIIVVSVIWRIAENKYNEQVQQVGQLASAAGGLGGLAGVAL